MKESLDKFPNANTVLQINEQENVDTQEATPGSIASPCIYDALVLDARLRQSLVTVRSLGRRGLNVAALETSKGVPTFSSRWCRHAYCAPSFQKNTEPYFTYLAQLLDNTGARVLIPSSDGTIALIRQYREQLDRRVSVALAKELALGIAVNKDKTLEIARYLEIKVPRGITIGSVNDVEAALHEIGLPAVVKPNESWLWGEQKGVRLISKLVTTPDEAKRAVEELTCWGGTALFQQFLSGRREAVSFIYANSEIHAKFAQWAKRTQPPLGGTSVLRQSIAVPSDIGEQATRLVREIELEGYSEVEFRRDSDGTPYLMEINPRLSASVEIAVRSGVDFPYLLYQWACGMRIDHVKSYQAGRWMRFLEGDIMTTVQTLQERGRPGVSSPGQALGDFITSFFVPMGYDYFDWKDPIPAWTAMNDFRHSLPGWLKKVI